ncbi:RNA polymerase sigma factor [Sphingobacterium bovistauri]|uniref:RNA polymerase sigma-70 factor n=1 Tax=Sphingobacterium bovistauri TaxID=2781959 RepID=A0ABS7Z7T0_9SPHI|nr:RNA polymerase sigma-70 factor [Sphingobacterium bovistauri]MCA5006247.1 RNA polymerase sigma-70 factor [Sphingobacterium bovistauri]
MKYNTELLHRVSLGDEIAFRKLFDAFHPNVYTTVFRITNDEYIAEDVVQDTFLKVWMNRVDLDEIENFEGWLYTIARNITFNILKKGKNYKQYLAEEGESSLLRIYSNTDYDVQDKDFQNLLQKAIHRLPPKQQQTYKLLKEQYLKRKEVAQILNVSPETVKYNIDQAMKSIRAYCLAHMKDMPLVLLLHFYSKYF